MITPTSSQLIKSLVPATQKTSQPGSKTADTSAPSEGLAASIKADGGLSFLRANLDKKLNEVFEKAPEETPEGLAVESFQSGADLTPQATADRIVSFALGFKNHFLRQNSQLSEEQLMAKFEIEVREGISAGFSDARNVLGSLQLMDEETSENVGTTWDLIQSQLDQIFNPPAEDQGE